MTATTPSFRSLAPRSASTALIALAAGIALLYYGRAFLVTLSLALITAFILEPFVGLLIRVRVPRALGSFVVCSLALCVVYLLGLGVFTQVSGVVQDFPQYAQRINNLADRVVAATDSMEQKLKDLVVPKRLREQPAPPPAKPLTRRQRAAESGLPQPVVPGAVPEVRIRDEGAPLWALLFGAWEIGRAHV